VTRSTQHEKEKRKMHKTAKTTITVLFIIALATSAIPILFTASAVAPSNVPPATNMPPSTVGYYNASFTGAVGVPSIGNITSMAVTVGHVVQSTIGNNWDVLGVMLSSPQATGTAAAIITNGPDAVLSYQEAFRNGTSLYTIANGVVTINNVFKVGSNELSVQRNGTHMTVDFNPASPLAITLPPALFPARNFSATWTLPAFHMDINGYGSSVFTSPYSTTVYPSGWTQIFDLNSYTANMTFTCPSWNNYTTTAQGGLTDSSTLRFINPSAVPFPGGIPAQTMDYYFDGGGTFTLPAGGNITSMRVDALHVVQSDHIDTTDLITVTLSGPLAKGSITAEIARDPNPPPISASTSWEYAVGNGTTTYTEVNGKVVINNMFNVLGADELKVQRNGTHVTVDFNPAKPVVITLDPATFPPASFPSTWTLPAFHMDFYGSGGVVTFAPVISTRPSGWTLYEYYNAMASNGTFTCPSWNNYTANAAGAYFLPLLVEAYQAPFAPRPPLDVTARQSAAVLSGWTWWFYVQNLGGIPPYTYQWYEGATPLQGQTQMVLPVTKSAPGVYTFYCVVMDSQGTATTSNPVTLSVIG
jgi:hypothetical protein